MARTIKHYLKRYPAPKRPPGPRTATAGKHVSVGWAWNPDDETRKALARGTRKVKAFKARADNPESKENEMATRKSKKATKKVTAKRKAAAKANGTMPLKKLCQQLKLDPKMARRKLRADKAMAKLHAAKGRWEFTTAQAKKAKAVLTA